MATQNTLSWNANTEADLAGYNVYRQIATGPFTKLNSPLVPTNNRLWADVYTVGGLYTYNVTAVDLAGNESAHSTNVSVTVTLNPPPAAPTGLAVVQS